MVACPLRLTVAGGFGEGAFTKLNATVPTAVPAFVGENVTSSPQLENAATASQLYVASVFAFGLMLNEGSPVSTGLRSTVYGRLFVIVIVCDMVWSTVAAKLYAVLLTTA